MIPASKISKKELPLYKKACREIIHRLLYTPNPPTSNIEINKLKVQVAREYHLTRIPSNPDILFFANKDERQQLVKYLIKRPVRSLSGVAVIAVMTKPFPCPHGKCVYCPGGPNSELGDVPQSYTGHEPATMRGIEHGFDPYLQVRSRLTQLKQIGHNPQKIELIIMGGTFPSVPRSYQTWFIKRCYDALNESESFTLQDAILKNETAKYRVVGLTIETRPDYAKKKHADMMLEYGTTRVELGVQNVFDDIYELVKRGHTVDDVIEATRILKDCGFKINYHMMPGLPGSSFERDLEGFKKIFNDPRFKPDMLKIYPTVVVKGTELYKWWRAGKYKPYSNETAAKLIAEVLHILPRWIRIQRVQRDIPAWMIDAGPTAGNMRQLAHKYLYEMYGEYCHCIRCREVGHKWQKFKILPDLENIKLKRETYEASEGIEIFLSYEDVKKDILIGFLRLRIPSEKAHRPEIAEQPSAIVRELHVYGPQLMLGELPKDMGEWQHRGYGSKLLKAAEKIAKEEYDRRKIVIISGVGVREYYMKHGYKRDGPYVSKYI